VAIETKRKRLAVGWAVLMVAAVYAEADVVIGDGPSSPLIGWLLLGIYVGALALTMMTSNALLGRPDVVGLPGVNEELQVPVRPWYRAAAGLAVALALVGFAWSVIGMQVHGEARSSIPFAAYFCSCAVLAYRAFRANRSAPAVSTVAVALIPWPFTIIAEAIMSDVGVKLAWSYTGTVLALTGLLYAAGLLAIATIVGFRPAPIVAPEARARIRA